MGAGQQLGNVQSPPNLHQIQKLLFSDLVLGIKNL